MVQNTSEEEYTVEKIIGKRIENGILQYKIVWAGYDGFTWEPVSNLNCDYLVGQFEEELMLQMKASKQEEPMKESAAFDSEGTSSEAPRESTSFDEAVNGNKCNTSSIVLNSEPTVNRATLEVPEPQSRGKSCTTNSDTSGEEFADTTSSRPKQKRAGRKRNALDTLSLSSEPKRKDSSSNASSVTSDGELEISDRASEVSSSTSEPMRKSARIRRNTSEEPPKVRNSHVIDVALSDETEGIEGASSSSRCEIPEKILGAFQSHGQLGFIVKYKDCDKMEVVFAKEANDKFPMVVIEFYEGHLNWL